MLAAKTSRHGSKLTKHAQTAGSRFGFQPMVWARLLSLHCACIIPYHTTPLAVARAILPGIYNYAAALYGCADCTTSGLKHIFCYQKIYMYDSPHLFLSSFAHVNSVPDLNFLPLLLLLNSSHIHLTSPQ